MKNRETRTIVNRETILRRVLPVILFIAIFISSNAGAYAASGWAGSAKRAYFGSTYSGALTKSDPAVDNYNGQWKGDAYKISVPKAGKVKVRIEVSYDAMYNLLIPSCFYIYKNDSYYDERNFGRIDYEYNSAYGYYYIEYTLKLNAGTYYICPACYDPDSARNYRIKFSYSPNLSKTKIVKLTAKKGAFSVQFAKSGTATGYQVMYSTNKSFSSGKTLKSSNLTRNVTNLKRNTTYYVKVRSYKKMTVDGKVKTYYSTWSAVKTIKTK